MLPFEVLVELCGYACTVERAESCCQTDGPQPHEDRARVEPGDPRGIRPTCHRCSSHVGWFASLGEDYDSPFYILALNRVFHDDEALDDWSPLPDNLVLLNHGHDGDCDCWDLEGGKGSQEMPVVYYALHQDPPKIRRVYPGFLAYLDEFCRLDAPRSPVKKYRRRAKRILAQFSEARSET